MTGVVEWMPSETERLAAICDAALPGEALTADELAACCFDDPGVVLGSTDEAGAVAACTRRHGDRLVGYVKLLAVVPAAQRRGLGRALLDGATEWARQQGADVMALGGSAPFYLWSGIDVRMTGMLVLAESAGFHAGAAALNMSAPTTFRSAGAPGVEMLRALDDVDVASVIELCRDKWPHWEPELRRGIEHGACIVGRDGEGRVVGFACHSVNRAGWVGPIGTDPAQQRRGIAGALMGEVCRDLAAAGHADAEISWVGPIGFYARTMGAKVSRCCVSYSRRVA